MWRALISAGSIRSTWMMWNPNGDSTTSEICPGRRRNAAASNSGTMRPRRNHPRSPPSSREPGSSEKRRASVAKSASCRRATSTESASRRATTLAATVGSGRTAMARNDTVAGRRGCWAFVAS
jgi:hypothetical protein